ncbi:MAG: alpha/beta hydrolase, partial [Rhodospirillaceae bacterium]|nr:alpha/beta hydrolase [Rhodospirillaceae bacterium]
MTVFKGLDADELERQYFLRGLRPEYEVTDIPGWIERSKAFAARSPGARFDLAYGPAERNRLDFFPATRGNEGFVLYIHGGYWQRG